MTHPYHAPYPSPPARFSGLAWTALILGIVGVVGSPIIFLNNLTAVIAGVGVILGIIALFGTRKVLAGIGVGLCVAGIAFTVMAQGAATAEFDKTFGDDPTAVQDVTVSDCKIVSEYGSKYTQATVTIRNSTAETQSYWITVSVNDDDGQQVGTISASVTALAAAQSTTLSGDDARGLANESARKGPATCVLADVDRFGS